MWRISPNGLVCNCSVNTCLSRLGECGGGKKAPHSDALKPLIEQPIAIFLLTVAGREGARPGQRNSVARSSLPGLRGYQLGRNQAHPEPGSRASGSDGRQGGLCLCGAGCSLLAPGLCRARLCVQLAAVKPCFLSGISVLTESIWAQGELPACWVLTCTHTQGGGDGGGCSRRGRPRLTVITLYIIPVYPFQLVCAH